MVRVLELPIEDLLEEDRKEVETLRKANQLLQNEITILKEHVAKSEEDISQGASQLAEANQRIDELTVFKEALETQLLGETEKAAQFLSDIDKEKAARERDKEELVRSREDLAAVQSDAAGQTQLLASQINRLKDKIAKQTAEAETYLERTQVLTEELKKKDEELDRIIQAQGDEAAAKSQKELKMEVELQNLRALQDETMKKMQVKNTCPFVTTSYLSKSL